MGSQAVATPDHPDLHLYSPLEPRQIRLLQFSPSTSTLLSFSLSTVTLDDANTTFTALSYCWGTADPDHTILINNHPFLIRKNLHSFLEVLQTAESTQPIWIDAICIDQTNFSERGSQVKLMGDLYSKADLVRVWLGEAEENSNLAFELIKFMNTKFSAGEPLDEDELLLDPFTTPNSPAWTALGRLICLPWFSRVWVVQEIVLARSAVVTWGSDSITWDALATFVDGVTLHQLQVYQQDDSSIPQTPERERWGWNTVLSSYKARLRIQDGRPVPMSIVMISWKNLATDPRDQIYGKLGFVRNQEEGLTIEPDYNIDTAEMYAEVTAKIIAHEKNLCLLVSAGTGYTRTLPGLPSWVPDYSQGSDSRDYRPFAAAGATKAKVSSKGNQLTVAGYMVDIVSEIGDVWEQHFDVPKVWDWFVAAEKRFRQEGVNDEEFWRTLCVNKSRMRSASGSDNADGLGTYFQAFKTSYQLRFNSDASIEGETRQEEKVRQNKCMDFIVAMKTALQSRRMCRFGEGRLGVLPPGSRLNDKVFLAFGGESPLLVREVARDSGEDKCYELVGPCWVNGIMDGEVLEMGFEEEEIILV